MKDRILAHAVHFRPELIEFCRERLVKNNPLVTIEEINSRLEKCDFEDLVNLGISLLDDITVEKEKIGKEMEVNQ